MRKLNTIQKVGNLNIVQAIDKKENGNTNHLYRIEAIVSDDENIPYTLIQFQDGARNDPAAITGIIDKDLLEIVRDRLKGFQSGDFATEDNAEALKHIEIALMYMNKNMMDKYEM
jgi:hypothetical protein